MTINPKITAYFDRAIFYLLVLFCLTATVSISMSEIGFFGAFFLWLSKMAYTRNFNFKRTPADFPLFIFALLTLVAVFIGLDGGPVPANRLKPLSLMLMFPLVVNNVKDKKTAYKLFLSLFVSLFLQSAIIIYKGFATAELARGIGIGGTMSVTLTAGELLVTLLGAVLCFLFMEKDKKIRLAAYFLLALGLLALAFTLARGAWAAFAAVLLVFGALQSKKVFLGVLVILTLVFVGSQFYKDTVIGRKINSVLDLKSGTTPQRFAMWRSGLRMLKDNPLGIGIDNVIKKYPAYAEPAERTRERGHLHNNYLQIAVERGVLALIAFLWFLYVVIKTAYVNYLKNSDLKAKAISLSVILALVAFLVTGTFEYGLGSAIYAPLVWFFAAINQLLITDC